MGRSHTSAQGRVQTHLRLGPCADSAPGSALWSLSSPAAPAARTLPPPRPPGGPKSSPAHPPGDRVRSRASACASALPPKGEDFLCSCTQLGLILLVGVTSGRRTLAGDHLRSVHNTFTSLSIFIPSSRPSWAFILFCNSFISPPGLERLAVFVSP